MVQDELNTEADIRRFLLGKMPEDQRSEFEEKFLTDEAFFEQIQSVEDELIEFYLRGMLSPSEQTEFEQHFLITRRGRERVALMRAMLDKLTQPVAVSKKTERKAADSSIWNSISTFFKTPSFAFAAALVILFALVGWFLLRSSNQPEIARQVSPTPAPTIEIFQPNTNQAVQLNQNSALNSNQSNELNSNQKMPKTVPANKNNAEQPPAPNRKSNTQQENTGLINPVFALFAGTVRSEGKTQNVNLPKNAKSVLLQLNLESRDYEKYHAEIVTPDGELVLKNEKLKANKTKINLPVPAEKLPPGDYVIKLSGVSSGNEIESVANYTFRVNGK